MKPKAQHETPALEWLWLGLCKSLEVTLDKERLCWQSSSGPWTAPQGAGGAPGTRGTQGF